MPLASLSAPILASDFRAVCGVHFAAAVMSPMVRPSGLCISSRVIALSVLSSVRVSAISRLQILKPARLGRPGGLSLTINQLLAGRMGELGHQAVKLVLLLIRQREVCRDTAGRGCALADQLKGLGKAIIRQRWQ